jgi:hypothetical protein
VPRDGIVGEPPRVVGVLERVTNSTGLALIDQRAGQSRDQAEAPIRGLEQHGTAVRAGVGEVEDRPQRAIAKIREQRTRCRGKVANATGLLPWRKGA